MGLVPTLHDLPLERRTLHGRVSRDLPPALAVDSGDRVRFAALDANWYVERPPVEEREAARFPGRDARLDDGHALCGPILVRGARPGAVLEVRVERLRPGPWGWTWAGGWKSPVNDALGTTAGRARLIWSIQDGVATGHRGYRVRTRPFLGWIGTAPAEPGRHSTTPPRRVGGNLDCKELVEGASLFLPVEVPGALVSAGDGHAAQGDGEAGGVALECPMAEVVLELTLHDGPAPARPWALTPAGRVWFGFSSDLNEATVQALGDAVDHLSAAFGVAREEALALASVAVDLRVTQVANGVWGVHALLPHGALEPGVA